MTKMYITTTCRTILIDLMQEVENDMMTFLKQTIPANTMGFRMMLMKNLSG